MKDKYYDKFISYDVIEHGSEFEPSTNFGLVCPECCSTSIDIKNDDGSISENISWNTYVCKDCGCKFTAENNKKLNEKGLKMSHLFETLIALSGATASISLILTIVFVFTQRTFALPTTIISVLGFVLCATFCNISNDM